MQISSIVRRLRRSALVASATGIAVLAGAVQIGQAQTGQAGTGEAQTGEAPTGRAQAGQAEHTTLDSLVAMLSARAAEGFAGIEQQLKNLDPVLVQAAAPLVAGMITDSRDEALAHGVEGIPEAIRSELAGYVPARILDAVRWCADCGGALSLQQNTFRLGYSPAITLDYVIVFQRKAAALTDPSLWAHELKHVMQYQDWGIKGFAEKYLEDFEAVEREAAEYRWEWMKLTGFLERRQASARSNQQ